MFALPPTTKRSLICNNRDLLESFVIFFAWCYAFHIPMFYRAAIWVKQSLEQICELQPSESVCIGWCCGGSQVNIFLIKVSWAWEVSPPPKVPMSCFARGCGCVIRKSRVVTFRRYFSVSKLRLQNISALSSATATWNVAGNDFQRFSFSWFCKK